MRDPIVLFIGDQAVLSSLQFALSLDNMNVADGSRGFIDTPACLVVDQAWGGDGLEFIGRLRAAGCHAPAILLVTNPTPAQRARGEVAGVRIIEKPLIGEDLTIALRRLAHGHRVEA